jgi:hypothetical protein
MLLLDVLDGSLIEVSGVAVVRYPAAHVDPTLGIVNDIGEAQVAQCSELDAWADLAVWDYMEQVSDADHPLWSDAGRQHAEPVVEQQSPAAVLAEILDTEDPDRTRVVGSPPWSSNAGN